MSIIQEPQNAREMLEVLGDGSADKGAALFGAGLRYSPDTQEILVSDEEGHIPVGLNAIKNCLLGIEDIPEVASIFSGIHRFVGMEEYEAKSGHIRRMCWQGSYPDCEKAILALSRCYSQSQILFYAPKVQRLSPEGLPEGEEKEHVRRSTAIHGNEDADLLSSEAISRWSDLMNPNDSPGEPPQNPQEEDCFENPEYPGIFLYVWGNPIRELETTEGTEGDLDEDDIPF